MIRRLLTVSLAAILLASCAMKTPETSTLFEKMIDPDSGIASYVLKKDILDYNQQSVYFVNKSMSEDGRFLLFTITGNDHEKEYNRKRYALIDFKKDKAFELNLNFDMQVSDIPDGKMYYIDRDTVYFRDFYKDPMKPVLVCPLPESYTSNGKCSYYCCHLTLNHDRNKIFLDSGFGDKFVQGVVDLKTGEWTQWWEDDYVTNHGQMNPTCDTIALCAYEWQFTNSKGVTRSVFDIMAETGVYPRLQLRWPGRAETVKALHNYATHERWNEQGDGFYWCTDFGVEYCDLQTREMEEICPTGNHAMLSIDKRYVVCDERMGFYYRGNPWRVYFWDRELNKGAYICSIMHGAGTPSDPSKIHPDPHPQFVKGDEYIIYTYVSEDGRCNVAVTPVAPIKERLEKNWLGGLPEKCDPVKVSQRITEQLLSTDLNRYDAPGFNGEWKIGGGEYVHYSVTSAWVSALRIAQKTGNHDIAVRMTDKFLPFAQETAKKNIDYHVDFNIFGALPLEIYLTRAKPIEQAIRTNDDSIYQLGMHYAQRQWDTVIPAEGGCYNGNPTCEQSQQWFDQGYSPQTRLWIDDMYMINLLQTQAFRVTGEHKYIDRAAREMVLYLDTLQREDGLFNHSPEAFFAWGRGDGWMAAGMPIILSYLTEESEYYAPIMEGYLKMMGTLLKWQREDGLWGQIIDDPESWDETSCSAMFAYGMLEGVKRGWLDSKVYTPAVRKAWLALCDRLDENANLADVCEGTGAQNSRDWYLGRKRVNGDPHGQAPMLWICNALL